MSISRRLAEETIRQVADANPIAEVIGACLPLRKTGAAYTTLCPFHQEKSPSFTVTPARQSFKCFGCGEGGDVIRFVMLHEGVGFADAIHHLAGRVGIPLEKEHSTARTPIVSKARQKPQRLPEPAKVLRLPTDLHRGKHAELRAMAQQRGLSVEGLELASDRGLLWFGSPKGLPAWIVTDGERINAQARQMNGARWEHLPNPPKAYTLPGSQARWGIGAKEADGFPFVALTEGGPDFAAAHCFIVAEGREADVAVVGMMGAYNDHLETALTYLANKRVRIFPHADAAGEFAAVRWAAQLERVGCTVDAFRFNGLRRADGGAVKDLNDLANLDADCFEAERNELSEVLPR